MEGQNQNPVNMGNMNMGNIGDNMVPPPEEKGHFGAWAGIVIIVVILALGGLYFWGKKLNNEGPSMPAPMIENAGTSETGVFDQSTEALQTQGTSDNISDIEADLNSTNLENLDADLGSI